MPILPDYLATFSHNDTPNQPSSFMYKNFDLHYVPTILNKHPVAGYTIRNTTRDRLIQADIIDLQSSVEDENGSIGTLLAIKAFVQLFFNPIVGAVTMRLGYKIPIFFGTINLLAASLSKLHSRFLFISLKTINFQYSRWENPTQCYL